MLAVAAASQRRGRRGQRGPASAASADRAERAAVHAQRALMVSTAIMVLVGVLFVYLMVWAFPR
jgi:hypothetical protein